MSEKKERGAMPQNTARVTRTVSVTKEEFCQTENYLRSYAFYKKLLRLDKYEHEIKTYAEYFEKEFEESIVKFGIELHVRLD